MVLGGNWRKPPRYHATMLLEVLKLVPKPLAPKAVQCEVNLMLVSPLFLGW